MPLNAVLDSAVLISAFLTPGGVADAVLQGAIENRFTCSLSEDIIASFVDCLVMATAAFYYDTREIFGFDAVFGRNGFHLPGNAEKQAA
jgi:hypothetical protein